MEHHVEEVTPVKRKVMVTTPAEEVDASLDAVVAKYAREVRMDGFRKGKAPLSVIEGRFKKDIHTEATTDLVNGQIKEIMDSLGFSPISPIQFDGEELVRGKAHEYSYSFEIMPEFELPAYEGVEVEQQTPEVEEKDIQEVLDRIRHDLAEVFPIEEARPPREGESALVSFDAREGDVAVAELSGENFEVALGEGHMLPVFEEMVKRTAPGESLEEEVTLPEDVPDEKLAGKTLTMRITVHSIRGKNIPTLDDELAQKAGGFESLEDMRQAVEKSYLESRRELHKSAAQKELLDGLIGQVEYAVPEYLVEQHQAHMLNKLEQRLRKQGKSLDTMDKSAEDIMSESRSGAEEVARAQVFLLSVAKKEGLSATEQEVEAYIKESAARSGQDFQQLASFYQEHGLLGMVRDRMVADKAMDLLYAKAVIKEVPARKEPKKAKQKPKQNPKGK